MKGERKARVNHLLREPCVCGGKLYIRESQSQRGKFVVLCQKRTCNNLGYGKTIIRAIRRFEEISRDKAAKREADKLFLRKASSATM